MNSDDRRRTMAWRRTHDKTASVNSDDRRRTMAWRGHGITGRGQAVTELALIVPLIALMLLGIVDLAGAVSAKMSLQAASAQGARIGAIVGNAGNTVSSCPMAAGNDAVDMTIVNAITSTQGINLNSIQQIQIYKADLNGNVYHGLVNTYTPPFTTANPYNWSSCGRGSAEPADSLGVHVTYAYHPFASLLGHNTFTFDDRSLQRLNPSKNVLPCPVADAPTNLGAHWIGTEPSATDAISWTAVPGASSYHIFADVNGAGIGATPVMTVSQSSGIIVASYPGNTTYAPASYEVRSSNYCGDGDASLPAPNFQYALPIAPTIITATASTTTTGSDYIAWTAVPDAQSYTVAQTTTAGPGPVTTITAPATGAFIVDGSTSPVTYTVTATSRATLVGPASTFVRMPPPCPVPAAPTSVAVSAPAGTTDTLSWTPAGVGAAATSWIANQTIGGTVYTKTVPTTTTVPISTTFTIGNWTDATYTVRGTNACGAGSPNAPAVDNGRH